MKVCPACGSARVADDWSCPDCGSAPTRIEGFVSFAPELAFDSASFRGDLFARLAELESSNFWFRARNALITWAMRRYLPGLETYLEIGCGTGFVLNAVRKAFPKAALSGSEIFSAGLEVAARRVPSATMYQMDATSIPFRDEFDAVGAFDVLEHIVDDAAVLKQVAAALRPGGGLIVTVPQHPWLWSAQDEGAFHVRRYTARGLRRVVEAAGLEIVRVTSFVSLLLPLLVVSRFRKRAAAHMAEYDALEELHTPPALNAVLERVMTAERALIRLGLSLPAGGSLLLVARKPVAGIAA